MQLNISIEPVKLEIEMDEEFFKKSIEEEMPGPSELAQLVADCLFSAIEYGIGDGDTLDFFKDSLKLQFEDTEMGNLLREVLSKEGDFG